MINTGVEQMDGVLHKKWGTVLMLHACTVPLPLE